MKKVVFFNSEMFDNEVGIRHTAYLSLEQKKDYVTPVTWLRMIAIALHEARLFKFELITIEVIDIASM